MKQYSTLMYFNKKGRSGEKGSLSCKENLQSVLKRNHKRDRLN